MKHEIFTIEIDKEVSLAEIVKRIKTNLKVEKIDLSKVDIKIEKKHVGFGFSEKEQVVGNVYYCDDNQSIIV